MEDIYDRSKWPSPEANPLVLLLQRGDEWYSNKDIAVALGLTERRALLSEVAPHFGRSLVDEDTALILHGLIVPTKGVRAANSGRGKTRLFSRRALVLAGMRTNTVNAAAFRDWLASRVAGEVANG